MPSTNNPSGSSDHVNRRRRSDAVRRTREQRRRENDRSDSSHGQQPLDLHAPLPIVQQSEVGSAATMSTLARHRLSRQRDHDPLGMTVQQAVEQLGEQNDHLNAALREPLPQMLDDSRNEESGEPRRKRRKRDNDPLSLQEIPRYGYYGKVVPGKLQMQVLTCDGGEHRISAEKGDLQVENILLDDESTYCSETPKCNIILKHRGEVPFALTRLVIRNPRKANQFSSRLQEGLVFVSMSVDDLHFRTERYDLVQDTGTSGESSSSMDDSPPRVTSRRYTDRQLLREIGSDPPAITTSVRDRLAHEWYDRYRAIHGANNLPASFPAAQAVRTTLSEEAEARRRDIVHRTDAILRHNSWQQIEPNGGPIRVSTSAQTGEPTNASPGSPEDVVEASHQGFNVIMTDDVQDSGPADAEIDLRRESLRAVREAERVTSGTAGYRGPRAYGTPFESTRHPHIDPESDSSPSDEEDVSAQRIIMPAGALPSMRMEPNEEHPMYGDGTDIRRAGRRRHTGRQSQPRKVEWVPNKIKRSGMGPGATGDDIMKPHAHFFIRRGKDSVALEFFPPVSGRYILFKLWAPPGKEDIDVQSVLAYGYATTRMFTSVQMR